MTSAARRARREERELQGRGRECRVERLRLGGRGHEHDDGVEEGEERKVDEGIGSERGSANGAG